MTTYILKQEDLDNNPILERMGLTIGDGVELIDEAVPSEEKTNEKTTEDTTLDDDTGGSSPPPDKERDGEEQP